MTCDTILDIAEVMDESHRIRPKFYPKEGSSWVPNGRYIVLRENGMRLLEITYRDGIVHGPYVAFWTNGKVSTEGQYFEGKQEGIWHYYNMDGTIHTIILFKGDREVDSSQYIYDDEGTLIDIIQLNEFK